jgi:lysophospholipase L1-like esterase
MRKNKLQDVFLLCLILIGSLLFLFAIPEFTIGSFKFRKIDLLADLKIHREDVAIEAIQDSVQIVQDSVVQLVEERCRPGITCIEDYSGDSSALKVFFRALSDTRDNGKLLRIAFYGDSFIEGDVFCGAFRDTLQSIFGGRGVGYVPITSTVTGFRNTIRHQFDNWFTSSLVVKRDSSLDIGPAGYSFVPLEGNWLEYKGSKQRFLKEFSVMKLFYRNFDEAAVQYTINQDTTFYIDELVNSGSLQEWSYKGDGIKSIRFEFYPADSLRLYGASFEGKTGVYVDNFSLRGNSGLSLMGLNDKMLKSFSKFRDYKLVILQFGLNSVVEDSLNYRAYTNRMVQVVEKLKKAYSSSSFLLLSVSDRSSNKTGRMETMNAIPAMRNAQRAIAQKTKIAFWDMYEAMGGENSMVNFAQSRPPLAAKDYTHLTFKGGKKLAGLMVKSLLYEEEKFQKRKKSGKKKNT